MKLSHFITLLCLLTVTLTMKINHKQTTNWLFPNRTNGTSPTTTPATTTPTSAISTVDPNEWNPFDNQPFQQPKTSPRNNGSNTGITPSQSQQNSNQPFRNNSSWSINNLQNNTQPKKIIPNQINHQLKMAIKRNKNLKKVMKSNLRVKMSHKLKMELKKIQNKRKVMNNNNKIIQHYLKRIKLNLKIKLIPPIKQIILNLRTKL